MIPLLDLDDQFHQCEDEVAANIMGVIRSRRFINGPMVKRLEQELGRFLGASWCAGVSSGTDALVTALRVSGVGPGHQVITTPYSFFATTEAIVQCGAEPVFADLAPGSFNMDVETAVGLVGERTRAILPVHLFGEPCRVDTIRENLNAHPAGDRVAIIEDAAQAMGAALKGERCGCIGDLGCFSFFPSKNLGGIGDGGMISSRTPHRQQEVLRYRVHGASGPNIHQEVGGNHRLDEIQAAALLAKLPHLERWTRKRIANAKLYSVLFHAAGLSGEPDSPLPGPDRPVIVPTCPEDCRHVFNQYVIRAQERDQLLEHLSGRGIATAVYYPLPIPLQPALSSLGYRPGGFPQAETASRTSLALPLAHLAPGQVEQVVLSISDFYRHR